MWENRSVDRRNTSLPDDQKRGNCCINPGFVVYCVCGHISLERNPPRNQGRVRSLPRDRKLKCGLVGLPRADMSCTYVRVHQSAVPH